MRRYVPPSALLCAVLLLNGCSQLEQRASMDPPCLSCHEQDRTRAVFPNHLLPRHSTECQLCHTQQAWKPAALDHSALPLVGGHSRAQCARCHASEPVPRKCVGCHAADRMLGPGHDKPGFSTECQSCHSVAAWKPASVDHSKFPFEGGHSNVACSACHPDPKAPSKPIGSRCADCHAKDRKSATVPDHLATGFPDACNSCHTVATWKSATFVHDKLALVGRHKTTPCASCHTDPAKPEQAKGTTCADCHAAERPKGATTSRPDHHAASFPLQCQNCHSSNAWKPAGADHSKFPLTGKHGGLDCISCHVDPQQPKLPKGKTCVGCHEADRSKSKLPDHRAPGFSTDCRSCHSTTGWKPATFDHGERFPLTSGHSGVGCTSCHAVDPVPKTCVGCHQSTLPQGSTPDRPDHRGVGFSPICSDCHNTVAWKPASFSHTKFPLREGHAGPPCTACHTDPTQPKVATGTTCTECHLTDRPAAGYDPDHFVTNFPTACQDCHTPAVWKGATFDHSIHLPLVGKHSVVFCAKCHQQNPVPTKCEGCHVAPATGHLGQPNSCDSCHSVNGWKPAAVDHSKFPLTGKHATLACASCHGDPSKPNVPKGTTCVGCHDADRSKPTIPKHTVGGFPTDCASCHTTNGWQPASFTHKFPIDSGTHKGLSCNTCHLDPNNLKDYSCLGTCHKHSQSSMDSKHKGRSGYIPGDFKHCINCHANGKT